MLTLADYPVNPELDCTVQQFGNGISILTVHCGSRNIVDLAFRSTGCGSCMVFNFGHPLSVKQESHTFHFDHMQCNTVTLGEGRFRLSQKGKGGHDHYPEHDNQFVAVLYGRRAGPHCVGKRPIHDFQFRYP